MHRREVELRGTPSNLASIAEHPYSGRMNDLVGKVRALSDAGTYGRGIGQVEVRETHMSWVFLAGSRVYKLKKPVVRPHVDFGTIERRRRFCEEEVRLNRRLAEPTYLGVVPLCQGTDARYRLGGAGRTVDWLVEMRRLPREEMLDERIARQRIAPVEVERLGDRLAAFYAGLSGEAAGGVCAGRLRRELAGDARLLSLPALGVAGRTAPVLEAATAALERCLPMIEIRVRSGRIVEGHGDLRPEHICLVEPLQIIDCLEFDRDFRLVDPYDEVRYLGLECAVLGAAWIGPILLDRLAAALGDPPSPALLSLYAGLRALTRARLCLAHLLETPVRLPEKWQPLASRYLEEAERALLSPRAP